MSNFSDEVNATCPNGVRHTPIEFDWWHALGRVFKSVEALRDGRAWFVLLAAFTAAGLALACARASLARQELTWAIGQGAGALFIAFYGVQAVGLMLMDRVRGASPRDGWQALEDALGIGHRTLVAVLMWCVLGAMLSAALAGLYWLCGQPVVGPWLFVLVVPVTVGVIGWMLVVGFAVVAPLTAPTVWAGASSWEAMRHGRRVLRHDLLPAVVMASALSVMTGLVGAVTSVLVLLGGRVMAQASVLIMGVDVPPQALMLGLVGAALPTQSVASLSPDALRYITSATVGGGVVFAVALVAPSLVYLRGVCEIFNVLAPRGRSKM